MGRPEGCSRCTARARRTGERRQRCRGCAGAWATFQASARQLIDLHAEPAQVLVEHDASGFTVRRSQDVAPTAAWFEPWLYLHARGLAVLTHGPDGKLASIRFWATW